MVGLNLTRESITKKKDVARCDIINFNSIYLATIIENEFVLILEIYKYKTLKYFNYEIKSSALSIIKSSIWLTESQIA